MRLNANCNSDDVEKYKHCFDYADVYGYYYDYLKNYGEEKVIRTHKREMY